MYIATWLNSQGLLFPSTPSSSPAHQLGVPWTKKKTMSSRLVIFAQFFKFRNKFRGRIKLHTSGRVQDRTRHFSRFRSMAFADKSGFNFFFFPHRVGGGAGTCKPEYPHSGNAESWLLIRTTTVGWAGTLEAEGRWSEKWMHWRTYQGTFSSVKQARS